MPERFQYTTLAKKALYKYSSFPFPFPVCSVNTRTCTAQRLLLAGCHRSVCRPRPLRPRPPPPASRPAGQPVTDTACITDNLVVLIIVRMWSSTILTRCGVALQVLRRTFSTTIIRYFAATVESSIRTWRSLSVTTTSPALTTRPYILPVVLSVNLIFHSLCLRFPRSCSYHTLSTHHSHHP